MNGFTVLPDHAILHIFSFMDTTDLLSLSTVDKRFYKIITKSKPTKDKIPFILDFSEFLQLAFVA